MEDRIIICRKDDALITALFRENRCRRLSFSKEQTGLCIGDIYVGRVSDMVPKMNACFVDIGAEGKIYVPLQKLSTAFHAPEHADGKIHEGDSVAVQIDRLSARNKPAAGTGELSLCGNTVVVLSGRKGLIFSKKINDREFIASAKDLLKDSLSDNFGIMLRTNSVYYDLEQIRSECSRLTENHTGLSEKFPHSVKGTCLYRGAKEYLRLFRDEYLSDLAEIITDDGTVFKELSELFENIHADRAPKIRLYDSEAVSLYAVYDMKRNIEEALRRKVFLKSGGTLVFDRTEAMTVVDVNSGSASGGKQNSQSLSAINLEAAEELARQMELRNLSGMILADFINTDCAEFESQLLKSLREQTAKDRSKVTVVDITPLGIVEITREKSSAPIAEQIKEFGFVP